MKSTVVTLAQSPEQQRALFGYAALDGKIFDAVREAMVQVGNFGWLNPHYTRLWAAIEGYRDLYADKHPTRAEIESSPEVLDNDHQMQKRLLQELELAVQARLDFDYIGLESDLKNWQKAVLIDKQITEMARLYNAGDLKGAASKVTDLSNRLEILGDAVSNRFEEAGYRAALEGPQRLEQAGRLLKYGITFLDDSLGGIAPNDLIVLGAKSGAGKTMLVAQIARANAELSKQNPNPKRVAFFALEAEEHEIERRIKYGLLVQAFNMKFGGKESLELTAQRKKLSYANWRLGRLEDSLGQFDAVVNRHMDKNMKNLRTFYRVSGDFGIDELERAIVKVAKTSDLIIIDHLHYIDVAGDNENSEYKKVVKKLRDLSLVFSKPIIIVAHLRKTFGKTPPLVPQLEDFHGSSDIVKIATTAIILGPARGHVNTTDMEYKPTWPTFMRVGKCRLDGSRLYYVGVGYFDSMIGRYREGYGVGHLSKGDTQWTPVAENPEWAEERGNVGTIPVPK